MSAPKKPRRDWRKELTGIIDLMMYRNTLTQPDLVSLVCERDGITPERYYTITRGQLADNKRRKWLRPRRLVTYFDDRGHEINGACAQVRPLADGWSAPVVDITPQFAERKVRHG